MEAFFLPLDDLADFWESKFRINDIFSLEETREWPQRSTKINLCTIWVFYRGVKKVLKMNVMYLWNFEFWKSVQKCDRQSDLNVFKTFCPALYILYVNFQLNPFSDVWFLSEQMFVVLTYLNI